MITGRISMVSEIAMVHPWRIVEVPVALRLIGISTAIQHHQVGALALLLTKGITVVYRRPIGTFEVVMTMRMIVSQRHLTEAVEASLITEQIASTVGLTATIKVKTTGTIAACLPPSATVEVLITGMIAFDQIEIETIVDLYHLIGTIEIRSRLEMIVELLLSRGAIGVHHLVILAVEVFLINEAIEASHRTVEMFVALLGMIVALLRSTGIVEPPQHLIIHRMIDVDHLTCPEIEALLLVVTSDPAFGISLVGQELVVCFPIEMIDLLLERKGDIVLPAIAVVNRPRCKINNRTCSYCFLRTTVSFTHLSNSLT